MPLAALALGGPSAPPALAPSRAFGAARDRHPRRRPLLILGRPPAAGASFRARPTPPRAPRTARAVVARAAAPEPSLPPGYDSALARAHLLAQIADLPDAASKTRSGYRSALALGDKVVKETKEDSGEKKAAVKKTDPANKASSSSSKKKPPSKASSEKRAKKKAAPGGEKKAAAGEKKKKAAPGGEKKKRPTTPGARKTKKTSADSKKTTPSTASAREKKKPSSQKPLPPRRRLPWTSYPWGKPGVAGGPPVPFEDLKYSPNGNALLQMDRQTIPYQQFLYDLEKRNIKEIHWVHDCLDRYVLIYPDDRVAYCQVPANDWRIMEAINKQGLIVHEIVEEAERDYSTGEYVSAGDNSAALFTQYGVPLIGVGIVWFIVWTMNRFKGDFDDRQKMLELQRREEAMAGVENDQTILMLKKQLEFLDAIPEEERTEEDLAAAAKTNADLDATRAKLQARARFFISEEGGGPGGGDAGGGGGSEKVDRFMKVDGMKVIGRRDVGEEEGDAVKAAMAAANAAKRENDQMREKKKELGERNTETKKKDRQGKLNSKMVMRDESEVVKFTDVAGIGDAKIELAEVVDFFRKPKKFASSGAVVPKGVMLTGPPGCGKTLLARAVAGESGATFFSLTASEFVEMFVGVGAARVRDLFAQAKKQAPSIIFIDELDAIGRPRGGGGSGNDERDQTLNQLLVELDGFGSDAGVVCIAATNRQDVLDPALVRAGRFDRKITVQLPTREGRLQILKVHCRDKPLAADVDLIDIAENTNGFSGAIIANVVNTACLAAAREGRDDVCQRNFLAAVEAEQLGKALPIVRGDANERRIARVHAACAVATALLMPDVCKLNFASIVPRETNADGLVALKDFPEVERPKAFTRATLTRHCRACFVPQLAEEAHYGFDDLSPAAAPYTARAREVATMMVYTAGMGAGAWGGNGGEGAGGGAGSEEEEDDAKARKARSDFVPTVDQFQVVDFLRRDVVEFLLRSTTADAYFASDREAREMLQREHANARAFVERQRRVIDAVTEALYEKKSLDAEALEALVAEHAEPEPLAEGSPQTRPRLEPWAGEMPEGSVPATNEWIET